MIEMIEPKVALKDWTKRLLGHFKSYPLSTVVALGGLVAAASSFVLFLVVAIAAGLLETGFKKLVKTVQFLRVQKAEAVVADYRSKGIL